MTTLSPSGEIGVFRDVDQFAPAKTQFACGFFSGAILKAMGQVGSQPAQSVAQMIAEAESWYAEDDGSNSISNTAGMTLAQEYDLITGKLGMHYQAIASTADAVRGWVRDGYPVMLTITEASVYDLALGGNPYTAWRPSGTHIFVVTGVTSDNNLLVRDPANCTSLSDPTSLRPGPRRYKASALQIIHATVVVPPWKPRPASATPPIDSTGATSPVAALYADISQYQPWQIDLALYRAWAAKNDGVARLAIRASEGTAVKDSHYALYRSAAMQQGIRVIHYHYADPDLNAPEAEAEFLYSVTGSIWPEDLVMLDYEKNVPAATGNWAYRWLVRAEQLYGVTPLIYASTSFVEQHLQDIRLARFGLVLANWTYDPSKRPACPSPWKQYVAWQYSDKENVPGIGTAVDANVFYGGNGTPQTGGDTKMTAGVPVGWRDDGTVLTAPNGITVRTGFREWVLTNPWDTDNVPLAEEEAANPVELGFTQTHGPQSGTRQLFLYTELCWTAARGVYVASVGRELCTALQKLAAPAPVQPTTPVIAAPNIADALVQVQVAQTALSRAQADLQQ